MHSHARGHKTRTVTPRRHAGHAPESRPATAAPNPRFPRCGPTSSYGHQELAATRRGLQRLLGEVGIIPRLVELDRPRARSQIVRRRAGRRPLVPEHGERVLGEASRGGERRLLACACAREHTRMVCACARMHLHLQHACIHNVRASRVQAHRLRAANLNRRLGGGEQRGRDAQRRLRVVRVRARVRVRVRVRVRLRVRVRVRVRVKARVRVS